MGLFKNRKPSIISKIFGEIKKSVKKNDETSSTRLTSYFILLFIGLFVIYFIGMGIYVQVTESVNGIPNETLIIFGSLLTHHLALLGINKNAETKQKIAESQKVVK